MLNTIQRRYIEAKAATEAITSAMLEEYSSFDEQPINDEELEKLAYAQEGFLTRHGYYEALQERSAAEDELITWARSIIQKHPGWEQVREVFEKYRTFPTIREKVIDLCLELQAPAQPPLFH